MQEPAARTACLPSEISFPCPMLCDTDTAKLIKREVSDGVIAPGYEPEALEILKQKKKGNYNVIQIDPDYEPEPIERKQVFGVVPLSRAETNLDINKDLLNNVVTENKEIPDQAKIDLDHRSHYLKVHPVQLRLLRQRTARPSASAQDSSPASTAPDWQARRQITGFYARLLRC